MITVNTTALIQINEDETIKANAKIVLDKINYWYEIENICFVVMMNNDILQLDVDMETFQNLIKLEEELLK